MRVSGGLFLVAALLPATAAFGATPKVSGTYNVSTSTVCQAAVPVVATEVDVPPFADGLPTTNDVITVDPSETTFTGELQQLFVTATFTPGAGTPRQGTVAVEGSFWEGDLVFTGTSQGTTQGITQQSLSQTGTFSVTATTLTLVLSGVSTVYQALYSDIVDGVAQHADLVQVYTPPGNNGGAQCIEHGTAARQ